MLTGWYERWHTRNHKNHSIPLKVQSLSLEALRIKGSQRELLEYLLGAFQQIPTALGSDSCSSTFQDIIHSAAARDSAQIHQNYYSTNSGLATQIILLKTPPPMQSKLHLYTYGLFREVLN